jgi:hypothetical protein
MNTDVEELLREGMERFTTGVQAPAGLARTAVRLRRQRRAIRAAVACGAVAVIAVAAIAVTGMPGGAPARPGPGLAQARTAAYVISRVENALATEHRVLRGYATGGGWGPTITWVYGARTRFVEFTGRGCGHAAPSGACTHHGGSEPYLAQGDAIIHGKRYDVYVTYFDRKWSGGPGWEPMPPSACSRTGGLEMSGPAIVTSHWPAFIKATLGCGAATVTGHVRIDGRETTKITGSPVTVRLQGGEARAVREKWVRARWTLYVDSTTYLPVRISGSNRSFGGPAPSYVFSTVTDIQWLRPTAANIAKTLVTVPPGFRRVKSSANQ